MKWAKANLPIETAEKIEKLMAKRKDLGYKSLSDFVLDSVRLRIAALEKEETERLLAEKSSR